MSGSSKVRVDAFLQIAFEEREAALRLADPLPRQAIYFVQQAVEKLLRGVLEAEGVPAGVSHNLRYLCELLPESHPLKAAFMEFEPLSAASTRYRYPSVTGKLSAPAADDVQKWLKMLAPLDEAVRKRLQKD
jgi:HEPN domain-containing protein